MSFAGTPLIRHYKGTTNSGGSVTLCHGSHFICDATTVSSTTTTNHFCDLGWLWVYTGVSGNWTQVVTPKQKGVGGIWGYPCVYAGTEGSGDESYTLTLYVWEKDGTSNTYTWTVNIEDPATTWATTNTIVVSTSGTFTGAPSGATQVTSSDFDSEIGTYAASGKRILFRGGETFDTSANPDWSSVTTQASPCLIGSFGTGQANITNSGNADMIVAGVFNLRSLLMMDLAVDLSNAGSDSASWMDIDQETYWCCFNNVDVTNLSFNGATHGKGFLFGGISVRADNRGIGLYSCSMAGDANNFYIEPAGSYFAVIDCTTTFGGGGGSGPTRFPISQYSVVAANRFAADDSASNPLRFHSHDHVTAADDSAYVVIAFNYLTHIDTSSTCRWMLLIGPDGNDEDVRYMHHFYVFGNHHVPLAETVAGNTCIGVLQLQDSCFINEIFDLSDARTGNAQCFDFQPYGGSGFSPHNDLERIRISNCIVYDGDSGDTRAFRLLLFGDSVTYTGGTTDTVTLRNTLIHKVSSGAISMIVDITTSPNPTNITANSVDQKDASATAVASVFANAISGTMTDARDFRHQGTYDPSGGLTTDHVRLDWDLKNRQQEVDGLDFGAFEEVDGGLPEGGGGGNSDGLALFLA